jgi:hypothetical protein
MRRAIFGFCILAGAIAPVLAHAEKAPPLVETWGAGNSSCGTWLEARSANNPIQYEEWVEGYLAGNATLYASMKNENVEFSTDSSGIFYWIDSFCRSNPTDTLGIAAQSFIDNSKTMGLSPVGTPPP